MIRKLAAVLLIALFSTTTLPAADSAPRHKILFFSKSSAFEHSVISWKKGQPSWAEKTLLELVP